MPRESRARGRERTGRVAAVDGADLDEGAADVGGGVVMSRPRETATATYPSTPRAPRGALAGMGPPQARGTARCVRDRQRRGRRPHPDDEVLGFGGALALLAGQGARLRIVADTDGEASHPHSPTLSPARRAWSTPGGDRWTSTCRLPPRRCTSS